MKFNRTRILFAVTLLPLSPFKLTAQDASVAAAQAAQMESVKRQQYLFSARQALVDGEKLYSSQNFDEAAGRFQYAIDALTNGGIEGPLFTRAQHDLAMAEEGQAEQAAKDSKFAQAATLLQSAILLDPTNPVYRQDLENLKRQQMVYEAQSRDPEGTEHNPAVTDEFKDRVAAVQKLLFQGDAYFRTGQYDQSELTYSKILILDPYNKAAREKMDYIERYKNRAAGFRHEEYEDEALLHVNQKWAEAISPDIVVPETVVATVTAPSNRAAITRKLTTIILDKVNFDKLDIATVIQFLTQKSKELDPDHVGINFVLNLNSEASATPATPAPGTAPAAGTASAAGTPPAATAAAPATQIHRAVSITLENVPLSDVLEYIIQQTNLKYSVDDYAVYLRPSIEEGQSLTVRTFLAPPSLFNGPGLSVTAGGTTDAPTTVNAVATDVQQALTDRGIRFPPGATATFLKGSSKLVVRDTSEQLDLIASLIEQLSKETPQVNIEAKIAEFNQDALKELTFNYELGATASLTAADPTGQFTPIIASTNLRDATYTSTGNSTAGLQSNGIDSLIQANAAAVTGATYPFTTSLGGFTGTTIAPNAPNTLTIGAILDHVGFAAVINAINNMTGVSLVSAPSVTTENGLKANIDVVREFPYPSSFEKPKLSNSDIAYSAGAEADLPLVLAIPPTPREFVTQDVGVSLEVQPTTYPDQRIDLDITKAQVIDFDGFINYGVPIVTRTSAEQAAATILTNGVINQPVFNLRSMVTRLQVLDGQTAVLGGLLREDTQEINDKVPILGDLPLIGRAFQSKVSERTKKNLIIFITARLVRPNGKPQYLPALEAEPIEEKLPDPEPMGPGVNLPLLPEGQPNS